MKKIIKTNFYSENEVPFLLLNLKECYGHVDKFIAYEFNYTKSGLKKSFVDLNNYWNLFEEYSDKFEYYMIDLDNDDNFIKDDSGLSNDIQKTINEPYSRNYFSKLSSLDDSDYIFSVDADEIIYGNSYSKLIEQVDDLDSSVRIRMHFFWNGINHLTSKPWRSPIVCKYKHLKNSCQKTSFGVTNYPQWRDDDSIMPEELKDLKSIFEEFGLL
jgi:hypothetical protein